MFGDSERGGATTALRFVTCDLSSLTDCCCMNSVGHNSPGSASKRKSRSKPSPLSDSLTALTAKRLVLGRPTLIDRLITRNKTALQEMETKKRGPGRPPLKITNTTKKKEPVKRKRTESANGLQLSPAIKRLRSSKGGSESDSSESRTASAERKTEPAKKSPKKANKKSETLRRFSGRIHQPSLRSGKKRKDDSVVFTQRRVVKNLTHKETKVKKKPSKEDKTDSNSNVCTENDSNEDAADSTDSELSRATSESSDITVDSKSNEKVGNEKDEEVKTKKKRRKKRDSMWVRKIKKQIKAKVDSNVGLIPPSLIEDHKVKIEVDDESVYLDTSAEVDESVVLEKSVEFDEMVVLETSAEVDESVVLETSAEDEALVALETSDIPVLDKVSDESINVQCTKVKPIEVIESEDVDVTMPKLEKEVEIDMPIHCKTNNTSRIQTDIHKTEDKRDIKENSKILNLDETRTSVLEIKPPIPATLSEEPLRVDERLPSIKSPRSINEMHSIEMNGFQSTDPVPDNSSSVPWKALAQPVEKIPSPEKSVSSPETLFAFQSTATSSPLKEYQNFQMYVSLSTDIESTKKCDLSPVLKRAQCSKLSEIYSSSSTLTDDNKLKETLSEVSSLKTDCKLNTCSEISKLVIEECGMDAQCDTKPEESLQVQITEKSDISMKTTCSEKEDVISDIKEDVVLDPDSTAEIKPQSLDDSFGDFSLSFPDDLEVSSQSEEETIEDQDPLERVQRENISPEDTQKSVQVSSVDTQVLGATSNNIEMSVTLHPEQNFEPNRGCNSINDHIIEPKSTNDITNDDSMNHHLTEPESSFHILNDNSINHHLTEPKPAHHIPNDNSMNPQVIEPESANHIPNESNSISHFSIINTNGGLSNGKLEECRDVIIKVEKIASETEVNDITIIDDNCEAGAEDQEVIPRKKTTDEMLSEILEKEKNVETKNEELTIEQRQMKESVLQALGLKSLTAQPPEEKPKRDGYTGTLKAVIKLNRTGDKKRMVYKRSEDTLGELEYRICSQVPATDGVPITHLNDIAGIRKNVSKLHDNDSNTLGSINSNGHSEDNDTSFQDDSKAASAGKESNLIIPEKSSSFSIHPGRLCSDVCTYCFGKFGCLDTPCHVAQLKDQRQKKILDNEPHLTAESCLCDACYRYVDRRANVPSKAGAARGKPRIKLPASSHCCVNLCAQPATHTTRRKWLIKLKKSIANKLDIDLEKAGAMYYPLCAQHHYWVDYFTVCGICRKRLNPNHLYSLQSETDTLNLMLAEDGIPARLSDKLFLCKLCRYYSNLRIKYADPSSIPSSGQIFYRDYRRKILTSLNIPVSDSEDEPVLVKEEHKIIKPPVPVKKPPPEEPMNISGNCAGTSTKSDEDVMSLSKLATLLGEQPEQQARIQVKFGNVNIGRLSNLNIGQGGLEERTPYSEVGLQANLDFQGPVVPDGSWERCVSTIQFDKRTKKLWQDLQKPYGNQSSFLRHLVMLEKYWREGYLSMTQAADERVAKYLNGVKNRIKAFEGSSDKTPSVSTLPSPTTSTPSSSGKYPLITNTGEIEVTPIKNQPKKVIINPEKKHMTPLDRAKALVRMVPPAQRYPTAGMQQYRVPMYNFQLRPCYHPPVQQPHRPPPLLKIHQKPVQQFYSGSMPPSSHMPVQRQILPKLPRALTVTHVPPGAQAITLNRSGITIEKQTGSPIAPTLPMEKPSISVFREPAPGPS